MSNDCDAGMDPTEEEVNFANYLLRDRDFRGPTPPAAPLAQPCGKSLPDPENSATPHYALSETPPPAQSHIPAESTLHTGRTAQHPPQEYSSRYPVAGLCPGPWVGAGGWWPG